MRIGSGCSGHAVRGQAGDGGENWDLFEVIRAALAAWLHSFHWRGFLSGVFARCEPLLLRFSH
jgi:hypothetical protein